MRKIVLSQDGGEIEVLRVPFHFQSEKDYFCVPFSLMMATHYFVNVYIDSVVRRDTPNLSIEEMLKITKTRDTGTIVDNGLMKRLNEKFPSLEFEIARGLLVEALVERFENNLPTIILYDCSYLMTEIPGAHHAGVVVGFINEESIILNNPWLGPFTPVDLMMFRRSWEIEGNQAIIINPKKQRKLEDFANANNTK